MSNANLELQPKYQEVQVYTSKDIEGNMTDNTGITYNDDLKKQKYQKVQNQALNQQNKLQNSKNHSSLNYRPDIDGLRAVAIILVIIFHTWPLQMHGGYIGVDVFFVISGFLISQIIIKEVDKDKFSIINFYCRRVKRIHPALILILIFSLFVISKFQQIFLVKFSINTLFSSIFFATNIQILTHTKGYFDADLKGDPLLHLWSLGVEQQFYIIWPFLLLIMLRKFRNKALLVLVGYTLISFIMQIVAIYQNAKFAFYFPFCRFWQMSIGGILGYLNFKIKNNYINNALSTIGLLVIIIAAKFLMNEYSLFPGFWALVPSLGSAAIIQANNEAFVNKYILSSKPFVFIGKISYSLYLWHWPFLVFSRMFYPAGSQSIFSNLYFITFLTFVFTILTYYLVENPIRKLKSRKIVILLLILMVGVGVSGYVVRQRVLDFYASQNVQEIRKWFEKVNKQMIPEPQDYVTINGTRHPNFSYNKNRIPPTSVDQLKAPWRDQKFDQRHGGQIILQKQIDENSEFSQFYQMSKDLCANFASANEGKSNRLFLLGDSHIMKISYRFQQLYRIAKQNNQLDSFPTILTSINRGGVAKGAFSSTNNYLGFLEGLVDTYKPQRILFAWNWFLYFCQDLNYPMQVPGNCDVDKALQVVNNFIKTMKQYENRGIEVYTIGVDINYIGYHPFNMVDDNGIIQQNIKPFKYSDYRKKYEQMYTKIQSALNNANIKWIDSTTNLCWEDICHVTSPKGYTAMVDIDHMGKYFARHWYTVYDHLVKF